MNRYFGTQTLSGEWHALLPRYLLLNELVKGKRILDVGCGTGLGASLLRQAGASHVDAIDHRAGVIEMAKNQSQMEGLLFQVMFWEELGFDEGSFDYVLCLDPSAPVTDLSLLIEVQRVLKSDGLYICAVERKKIGGLEIVLPQYGYPTAAEKIDLYGTQDRVPQLGEVKRFFNHVKSIVQRPELSYIFSEGKPISTHSDSQQENDKYADLNLETDNTFCDPTDDPASVEIWFCGENSFSDVPEKIVRLPYHETVQSIATATSQARVRSVVHQGNTINEFFDDLNENDSFGLDTPTHAKTNSTDLPTDSFSYDDNETTSHNNRRPNFMAPSNDFEERISTNRQQHVKRKALLPPPGPNDIHIAPDPKDAEIRRLTEKFEELNSVVERQSQLIEALLHKQSEIDESQQEADSTSTETSHEENNAPESTPEESSSSKEE